MAPTFASSEFSYIFRRQNTFGDWRDVDNVESYIVESWGEGFMFGALLIMSVIAVANMRRGVLLHKLILFELLLAMSHGTFCFMAFRGYGWYLSSTAALLYCSYFIHNIVAWMKIAPFFIGPHSSFQRNVCKWVRRVYFITLAMTAPALVFQIFNNFRFFNNVSTLYRRIRPYEPLMRDPWWIFSCLTFFHVIKTCYGLNVFKLVRKSPRFGILIVAMCLAIAFTAVDILASIISSLSTTDGINPYWKLALVFKCLTDNIMLDDFKSVLQRLRVIGLGGFNAIDRNLFRAAPNGTVHLQEEEGLEDAEPWSSSPSYRRRMFSLSRRRLDDGETLDKYGKAGRNYSMAASATGKTGVKIRELIGFPLLLKSAEKQVQVSIERNKPTLDVSKSQLGSQSSYDKRESRGSLVFIPTFCDPVVEDGGVEK